MKLPATIHLGAHAFKVDASEEAGLLLHDESASGDSYPDRLLIRLDTNRPHTGIAETLLHELMHCVWAHTGLKAHAVSDHEEQVIAAVAPPLLEALRRNPDLVAYLTASGTGQKAKAG